MIDTKHFRDVVRTGRLELIERIATLCDELDAMRSEMRQSLVLPGWTCPGCGGFNGEAKARRETCRSCNHPRSP